MAKSSKAINDKQLSFTLRFFVHLKSGLGSQIAGTSSFQRSCIFVKHLLTAAFAGVKYKSSQIDSFFDVDFESWRVYSPCKPRIYRHLYFKKSSQIDFYFVRKGGFANF